MIVVMKPLAEETDVERVIDRLVRAGCDVHRSTGSERTILGAIGVTAEMDLADFEILPGVEDVVRVSTPYRLVSRAFRSEGTQIEVGEVVFGGEDVVLAAGPAMVESEEQIHATARAVAEAGAKVLRGSAFATRGRPYAFQGKGEQALVWLRAAADEHGLLVATHVNAVTEVAVIERYADLVIVGARHMQNTALLREVGGIEKPVILKRGVAATLEDLLLAAEAVAVAGNDRVLLCERGIRTFEPATRYTLDLSAIPVLRERSHLPILVDPSDGTGHRGQVGPMARAAVAAGADGLLVEVHHDADAALADAAQTLYPSAFQRLMDELRIIVPAVGRSV